MGEEFSKAVLAIQSRLANRANSVKEHRFHALYVLLCRREWLEEALDAVLDNSGAITSGVDGVSKRDLFDIEGKKRTEFLDKLQKELKTRNYHPFPVLRKYTPKRNKGDNRPIGIPTLKDRVVQMLLKMVLEPIFECDFIDNSNGFRPGRSTLECVLPLYRYGNMQTNYSYVIEGDIKGCFDNIDHETLMKSVQKRIGDKWVLRLIWRFLKAPVKECKVLSKTRKGVPQGGILSPLLANIALNIFDQYWFEHWGNFNEHQREQRLKHGQANCVLFRYADDFILSAKGTKERVEGIMMDIKQFFADILKLELSKDKTRVVPIEEGFKFLGFQISRERLSGFKCVRLRPTQENVIRCKARIQSMLGKDSDGDDPAIKIAEINRVLQGWSGYYFRVNAYKQFLALDYYARQLFLQWFCRSRKVSMPRALTTLTFGDTLCYPRKGVKPLYRMSSRQSEHTALNHKAVWKYRHIVNPYLMGNSMTNAVTEPDDPMKEADAVRSIHSIDKAYGEYYLESRATALLRDGYRCIKCGSTNQLATHHIKHVPRKGRFDVKIVHGVNNLQTLCMNCHIEVHRN